MSGGGYGTCIPYGTGVYGALCEPLLRAAKSGLGCGTYEALILTRGGLELVAEVPWATLQWTRTLGDTGQASVVANTDCGDTLGRVLPWRHELAVYRDGEQAWVGPVFQPDAPVEQFEVQARDLSAWWDHRQIHNDYTVTARDLALIFADLAADAMAPDNSPGMNIQASRCGISGGQQAVASQHPVAGQLLRSVADSGVDWTVLGRNVLVGGYVTGTEPIGLLTDASFVKPPKPVVAGSAQANSWVVRGAGTGAAGDAVYGAATDREGIALDGLLEAVVSDTNITDPNMAAAQAAARVALTGRSVLSVEEAYLAPEAPFTLDQLVPGVLFDVELEETAIPVSGTFRLYSVTGSAQAAQGAETVGLVLHPVGGLGYRRLPGARTAARDQARQLLDRLARLEQGGPVAGVVSFGPAIVQGDVSIRVVEGEGSSRQLVFTNTLSGATFTVNL